MIVNFKKVIFSTESVKRILLKYYFSSLPSRMLGSRMKLKLAPVDSNLWGKKGKSMRLTLTPADSHVHIVQGKKGKSMKLTLTPADSLVNCILYRVRKGQLTGYEHRKLKNILIFLSHLSFLIIAFLPT